MVFLLQLGRAGGDEQWSRSALRCCRRNGELAGSEVPS
jgi:hypothetical protein